MRTIEWLRSFNECIGRIPDNYLVIDTETSGLSQHSDLILQVGWCEIEQRRVVDNGGALLNWFDSPGLIDVPWLRRRLLTTRAAIEAKGDTYRWNERMLRAGKPPLEVLADLLVRLQAHDLPAIVAHNGYRFDGPMIASHFRRFLLKEFHIPDHQFWDTGALEKGIQMDLRPVSGDTPISFADRVMAKPAKIKWSLEKHCAPKYWLAQRFDLDMSKAHTAPHDCLVTHHLLEVFREMINDCARKTPCSGSALMKVISTSNLL